MIEHINPTKATASSNESPCVMILHMTSRHIKNNKVTMGYELNNIDEVHREL